MIENKRNFFSLFFAQAFSFAIASTMIFSGGLIGLELANDLEYATLPIAFLLVGNAILAYPASKIMQIYGRKMGFILGNIISLIAVSLACIALINASFVLFCLSTIFLGFNLSFINQYRFAVVEGVHKEFKNKTLSFLTISSMIGAVLTLQVMPFSRHWFDVDFLGSYVFLFFMLIMALISLSFYKKEKENKVKKEIFSDNQNILLSKKFIFTVLVSATSYIVMSSIMVATPLYLKQSLQSSTHLISIVIQAHMMAMFLPSLFSGFLVDKFSKISLIKIGVLLNLLAILFNTIYPSYTSILIGLILLGVAWHFMFISSSLYLVENFTNKIKYKAQGISEVFTFGSQATASLLSGVLLFNFGWNILNLLLIPLLIIIFIFSFSKKI